MFTGDDGGYGWMTHAARAAALIILVVVTLALATQFSQPYPVDFVSYWAAGNLALDGNPAGAYDYATHRAVEEQAVAMRGGMAFPYPPPFLLFVAPFSLLPYAPALLAWVVATFAFYLLSVRSLFPRAGWLAAAFPPVATNAIIGQNGFLTCGFFAAGLALLPKRPWLAGLVFGMLILKPQLGLALPFVLLAGREWRAFAGAAASAIGLFVAGAALFGTQSYLTWLAQAPLYASVVTEGLTRWVEMASLYASLRLAGLGDLAAVGVHVFVAALAIGIACVVWRRTADLGARAGSLAAATVLASPYLYGYDTLLLVLPFLWLAESASVRLPLLLVWIVSLVGFLQIWSGDSPVNVAPLAAILLLFLVWRRTESARPEPDPSAPKIASR